MCGQSLDEQRQPLALDPQRRWLTTTESTGTGDWAGVKRKVHGDIQISLQLSRVRNGSLTTQAARGRGEKEQKELARTLGQT